MIRCSLVSGEWRVVGSNTANGANRIAIGWLYG